MVPSIISRDLKKYFSHTFAENSFEILSNLRIAYGCELDKTKYLSDKIKCFLERKFKSTRGNRDFGYRLFFRSS